MHLKAKLPLVVLGVGLTWPLANAAQATPFPTPSMTIGSAPQSNLERVLLVRKCWTRRGVAHCRWVDGKVYPYRWYDPNRFRTGSSAWWRSMDREGRGGFRSP